MHKCYGATKTVGGAPLVQPLLTCVIGCADDDPDKHLYCVTVDDPDVDVHQADMSEAQIAFFLAMTNDYFNISI